MRNARLAETVLSLVAPPERAQAMVGDLVEMTGNHGPLWFWSTVVSTASMVAWRGYLADWWRLTLLSICGLLFTFALTLPLHAIGLFLSIPFTLGISATQQAEVVLHFDAIWAFICMSALIVNLGRWLAHRAPDRELAASVATGILFGTLAAIDELAQHRGIARAGLAAVDNQVLTLLVLSGAIMTRRFRLRTI